MKKGVDFLKKYTILIPAMLDFHFPLLKYAFCSHKYDAVILENEENIIQTGLEYTHNDMCFPCVLIIGQMIEALKKGGYSAENTLLMIPQAGDACRGSNYIHIIRKALKKSGFGDIPIISLNFKGLEKKNNLSITPAMVMKAICAIMFSDMLMILKNQIEPYEKISGTAMNYTEKWRNIISEKKYLGFLEMKKLFREIAEDFKNIETEMRNIQRVGVIGELYVKYCHLGNKNLEKFLRSENCEYMINGFSWYILYYMDTHLSNEKFPVSAAYKAAMKYLEGLQREMVKALRDNDFICFDEFSVFRKISEGFVNYNCCIGDGWLMGGEICGYANIGIDKVICVQPFGCMPNHVFGKGIYSSLQRKIGNIQLISIDYDSGLPEINIHNRIKLSFDYS